MVIYFLTSIVTRIIIPIMKKTVKNNIEYRMFPKISLINPKPRGPKIEANLLLMA